jgi:hypothetical protein
MEALDNSSLGLEAAFLIPAVVLYVNLVLGPVQVSFPFSSDIIPRSSAPGKAGVSTHEASIK